MDSNPILTHPPLETSPQMSAAAPRESKSPKALLCKSPVLFQQGWALGGNQLHLLGCFVQLLLCRAEHLVVGECYEKTLNAPPKSRPLV